MASLQKLTILLIIVLVSSCSKKAPTSSGDTVASFSTAPNTSQYINSSNNNVFDLSGSCTVENADILITVGAITDTVTCTNLEWSTQLDLSSLADGPITINIKQDPGKVTEQSLDLSLTKDTVPPTSVDSLTTGSTEYNGASSSSNFIVSGACSEDGTVEITATGISKQTTTCTAGTYSVGVDLTGASDGTVNLAIALKDPAGNSTTSTLAITKDTVNPTAVISASDSGVTNQNPMTLTIQFSEDVIGFADTDLTLTNATVVPASFTAVDGDTYTVQVTPTGEGTVSVDITASSLTDQLLNGITASSAFSIVYDQTAPSSTGLSNDAVPKEVKTWTWGCSDSTSCTYRYVVDTTPTTDPTGAFSATTTTTASGNGTYYLHLQIQDAVGNISATEHYSVILADVTAPVVTGLSDDSTVTNSKTHTWTCTDASACTFRYVVDQNASTGPAGVYGATTTLTTTTGDGTYYLHVQAKDAAANESAVVHVSFVMDTTAPVLTGLTNDATIAKTKTWSWGCTDVNTCTYSYEIDQTSNTTPSSAFGSTVTASQTTGDGVYYLHVKVKDSAGNTALGHYSVTLDNTDPVLTGLAADATIAKTKTWSWGCTDASSCTYRYEIDLAPTTAPSGGYGSTTTASQSSGDGIYYIHVEVKDAAGNSALGHYSVTLDNTAPVITGLSNDTVMTASKTWNWGCTDDSTCTYRYIVDHLATTAPTGAYSATTSTVYSSGYGYYYLHVQAVDEAGNVSAVKHVYAPLNASMQTGGDVMASLSYTGDGASARAMTDVGYSPSLVWIKNRDAIGDHSIFTSATGANNVLLANDVDALTNDPTTLTSFDSLGFTLDSSSQVNAVGQDFVSWVFKENTNFMDIVTYTGNGTQTTPINHSLGTIPGLMMIKNLTDASDWVIYQKDMNSGETEPFGAAPVSPTRWVMNLNSNGAVSHVEGAYFANVEPTSTQFTLGSHAEVNANTKNYVAILFASSTSNVIKTGLYTGNGNATGPTVALGYEPQWIMIKRKDSTGDWKILDAGRSPANARTAELSANLTGAEVAIAGGVDFSATGFQIKTTDADYNANGGQYIYLVFGK